MPACLTGDAVAEDLLWVGSKSRSLQTKQSHTSTRVLVLFCNRSTYFTVTSWHQLAPGTPCKGAEAEFDASQSQRMKLNLCKDRAGGRVLNGAQLCHHLLPLCLTGCLQALEV